MEDYIDVLLEHLSDQLSSALGSEYFSQLAQEGQAFETLSKTFSAEQRRLFRTYEDARNATASLSEDALARQASLLDWEIYR